MIDKKKKRKDYSSKNKTRNYEIRDYFARKMVSTGLTIEKFNQIIGLRPDSNKKGGLISKKSRLKRYKK